MTSRAYFVLFFYYLFVLIYFIVVLALPSSPKRFLPYYGCVRTSKRNFVQWANIRPYFIKCILSYPSKLKTFLYLSRALSHISRVMITKHWFVLRISFAYIKSGMSWGKVKDLRLRQHSKRLRLDIHDCWTKYTLACYFQAISNPTA